VTRPVTWVTSPATSAGGDQIVHGGDQVAHVALEPVQAPHHEGVTGWPGLQYVWVQTDSQIVA
jgi:hypothetical protein